MLNRWFRRGTVEYPPSLPDLIPANFFVRGYVKDKVYRNKPETIAKMKVAIEKEYAQMPK